MPATLDSLFNEALALPPDQRVALAYRLLTSAKPEVKPEADAAWEAEIAARMALFDAGETQTISSADVFKRFA